MIQIEKNTQDVLTPIFDFTSSGHSLFAKSRPSYPSNDYQPNQRVMHSGGNVSGNGTTKRSVSETKKKYVAAGQNWKCAATLHYSKGTSRDLRTIDQKRRRCQYHR